MKGRVRPLTGRQFAARLAFFLFFVVPVVLGTAFLVYADMVLP